ncbi:ABC transporter ATP-binding protein [Mycoplasmopsis pulmonis]|uniref:ABC transporter ATP-binding protein n=1 Tax=Mycoplasmopsis pulmonis TaxID=2107 RepID=UPI0010050137|nr:ABC transporter ATP-binding protein [Mycoplasmopsis pulmonis]VEU68535.1 ABC transporter ATP-binding protein [Mycoplasmopsis pulmonis]
MNKKDEKAKIKEKTITFDSIEAMNTSLIEIGQSPQADWKTLKIINRANNKKRKADARKKFKNLTGNIIDVVNVSKIYTSGNLVTSVLKGVNFHIKKGEFVILYGKSGSGKSTLLNLISGLDRPTKGDVVVNDVNLPYLSNNELTKFRRLNVSFIFQSYNLLENITGFDNVETGDYLQKDKSKKMDIHKLFEIFDLEDVKYKFPAQMSGGQKQRISILRALTKNTDLIFADEPTGALDEKTTLIVLDILQKINQQTGTTIIMVSHNPFMAPIAHKVIRLKEGLIERVEINKKPLSPHEIKWS